jgi:hypothetical protein
MSVWPLADRLLGNRRGHKRRDGSGEGGARRRLDVAERGLTRLDRDLAVGKIRGDVCEIDDLEGRESAFGLGRVLHGPQFKRQDVSFGHLAEPSKIAVHDRDRPAPQAVVAEGPQDHLRPYPGRVAHRNGNAFVLFGHVRPP